MNEITIPLWSIFGLVIILAAVFRAVRVWLIIVAVLFGAYVVSTVPGQAAKHTVDRITHPSSVSTSGR